MTTPNPFTSDFDARTDVAAPTLPPLKLDTMVENALQHPQEKRRNIIAFPAKKWAFSVPVAGTALAACLGLFFLVSTPQASADDVDDLMYLDLMILEMAEGL